MADVTPAPTANSPRRRETFQTIASHRRMEFKQIQRALLSFAITTQQ